ncbi:MAG TPA: AMP-binding protein [Acidimicrobiales bacterium]
MSREWNLRTVPAELAARYRAEGLWVDRTLGQWVEASIDRNRSNAFRAYSEVRPYDGTFGELDRAARSLAAALRRQGVGSGSVVVMQLPNWAEAAVTFWATAYLGAVIVPVVASYGAKEVDYILRAVTPEVVVTPERFRRTDFLELYEPLLAEHPDSRWLVVGDTPAAGLPRGAAPLAGLLEGEPVAAPAPVDPHDPAVIAFTSGTTRDPKGVIHSHLTLAAEVLQAGTRVGDDASGTGPFPLVGSPVGHFAGMLGAFLRPLLANTEIHLVDVWDPARVLRLMVAHDLTMAGGATYFLTSLLDHPDFGEEHLRRIPAVGLGGSPVPVAVARRAAELGIRLFRSYGCTEHPSSTASALDDPEAKRLETDGKPLRGVDLRLDDDGQIITRGPELFVGYTDPALTAAAFDADGWYHSGDVGVLDDDGYLTITDRVTDLIIRGGENISAQEIEELFLTLDGVAEVVVVAEPDERLGERVAAVFTTRPGAPAPTLDQVRDHLRAHGLGHQKWPASLHHVRDLPRTPSGKVQKYRLRQQLRTGQLEHRV